MKSEFIKFKKVTPLFFVSLILRIWKLGEIPRGLSLQEVEFGLKLAEFVGKWVLNPFVIRLPFAVIGAISVFLIYIFVQKLVNNLRIAYFSFLILAFLPWHVMQSRIYSLGTVALFIVLAIGIPFLKLSRLPTHKWAKLSIFLAAIIFLASILSVSPNMRIRVDQERSVVSKTAPLFVTRLFSNKFIESYRYRQRLFFENLDFGNFFFTGHPRQRWGVEETKKLYLALLPLIVVGLTKVNKKLVWTLAGWSLLAIVIPSYFENQKPGATLLLVVPLIILSAFGLDHLIKQKSKRADVFISTIVLVAIVEFIFFNKLYFLNFTETSFFPRRPMYKELTAVIKSNIKAGERVLVNERLKNPSPFFKFYFKKMSLGNFEFRDFNIWEETDLDKIFVDALPFEPSPNEPLYTESGNWPKSINVLEEFYDKGLRFQVVIYEFI